jgi:hypothetical protein
MISPNGYVLPWDKHTVCLSVQPLDRLLSFSSQKFNPNPDRPLQNHQPQRDRPSHSGVRSPRPSRGFEWKRGGGTDDGGGRSGFRGWAIWAIAYSCAWRAWRWAIVSPVARAIASTVSPCLRRLMAISTVISSLASLRALGSSTLILRIRVSGSVWLLWAIALTVNPY